MRSSRLVRPIVVAAAALTLLATMPTPSPAQTKGQNPCAAAAEEAKEQKPQEKTGKKGESKAMNPCAAGAGAATEDKPAKADPKKAGKKKPVNPCAGD